MKNLRYICCQPAVKYYTWQVELLINNFKKMGINPNYIDIVCSINGIIPEDWKKLMTHYNTVRFFFYNDTRVDKSYIPSIYFNLMKQHIMARPEIKNDVLFTCDSDIIFTKKPDFSSMLNDNIWYLSDTNSYINYDYIISKGNDIYEHMCDIVGIDKLIPKLMNTNSGGGQYIVKNTTYEFWEKVEIDSIRLYKYFCNIEPYYIKKHELDYPIQKWTAGMWSYLWNAWRFGNETKVDKRLDFTWSTDNIENINSNVILHNAGVTEKSIGLFFKGNYIEKLPYEENLDVDKSKASYYYYNELKEVGAKSILIDKKMPKITQMQLDPYGVCNAKCWYCPVRYNGNPNEGKEVMSVELLEKIIKEIVEERDNDGLVSKNFNGFYTAHYNEILLYPYLEELLELCRKYKLRTMVLSNGIALTPKNVSLIKKYSDCISGICLNIPAFEAETWSKRVGVNIKIFDKLISNINNAIKELPDMVKNKSFSIQVNGLNENSFIQNGGWLEKGSDFPKDIDLDVDTGELKKQELIAKGLFPELNIFTVSQLIDRAGLLDNVITNKNAIEKNKVSDKIIDCLNGHRTKEWIHINSSGIVFLCCNDYDFKYKIGDLKTQKLSDFWGKEKHLKIIEDAYGSICKSCAFGIYK